MTLRVVSLFCGLGGADAGFYAAVALELGLSYPAIARALHCRNHTSAMYLVRAGTLPAA